MPRTNDPLDHHRAKLAVVALAIDVVTAESPSAANRALGDFRPGNAEGNPLVESEDRTADLIALLTGPVRGTCSKLRFSVAPQTRQDPSASGFGLRNDITRE
jgi:hypothetical protein